MVCPYCGYEKNEDSDTVCRSCNRRIKYDMTYSPPVKKQKVYRPGITKTELLSDWSKISLQEYYKRFCPQEIVRKIESAMLGMWAGVFALTVWFVYEFLFAYGVDFNGMRGCDISGFYRLLTEVWLLVCLGTYMKSLLNMRQNFHMTTCFVSLAVMIYICFVSDLRETYMLLFLPPFIACIVLTGRIYDLTDAWRRKEMEREIFYEQNPVVSKERCVISIQKYTANLCPQKLKHDMELALSGLRIGAACIFAGFFFCLMQKWLEPVVKYENPYHEADVLLFFIAVAAFVYLYIKYITYVTKVYDASFFWIIISAQLIYLYEVTGVQITMLCWIVPAAAVLYLQIILNRITKLYDAEVVRESKQE